MAKRGVRMVCVELYRLKFPVLQPLSLLCAYRVYVLFERAVVHLGPGRL